MAERATVNQSVQIGVETTPGTGVAASKRLPSLEIDLSAEMVFKTYRPTGQKSVRLNNLLREWTAGVWKGPMTFGECVYPYSSLIRKVTPTTPVGGTDSRQWLFNWNDFDADTLAAYTIEQGGSVRAHKAAGNFFQDGKLKMSHNAGCEYDGKLIGQQFTDGITMTATPTEIELVPILPGMIDVYLDTTWAGLGTSKLLRFMGIEWGIQNRVAVNWPLNSANASWAAALEDEKVAIAGNLSVQADATGMALLTAGRNTVTKFLRIKATGPIIEGSIAYLHQLDLAVQIGKPSTFKNEDGSYDVTFDFVTVYDTTGAKDFEIKVINKVTAL